MTGRVMPLSFLDGRVILHGGDCIAMLSALLGASVDSVVTDPPYGIRFMGKAWDGADIEKMADRKAPTGRDGRSASAGAYDFRATANRKFQVWTEAWASEAFRVLKPGGHLVCFASTRTYHRMASGIEDAGFEIRDQIGWAFGSGFPKSHDVSKGIDKARRRDYVQAAIDLGVDLPGRSVDDWTKENHAPGDKWWALFQASLPAATWQAIERRAIGRGQSGGTAFWACGGMGAFDITAPATEAAKQWEGWGTALKPAWEPIVLARKPLIGTVVENVLKHGTGALNINGCRVETADDLNGGAYADVGGRQISQSLRDGSGMNVAGKTTGKQFEQPVGRWPANLVTDGSPEVLAAFPDSDGQLIDASSSSSSRKTQNVYGSMKRGNGRDGEASAERRYTDDGATNFAALPGARRGDAGSAARFFYTAKADAEDRLGSKHPTVKPLDLMQWLVRLVTPKGGTVLDPFAGTGTTGEASWREGMNAILIERDPEYQADIARRMELAENPTKRAAVAKTKNKLDHPDDLPLFARSADEVAA